MSQGRPAGDEPALVDAPAEKGWPAQTTFVSRFSPVPFSIRHWSAGARGA